MKTSRQQSHRLTAVYSRVGEMHDAIVARGGCALGVTDEELQAFRQAITELHEMKRPHPMHERLTGQARTRGIIVLSAFLANFPHEWSHPAGQVHAIVHRKGMH